MSRHNYTWTTNDMIGGGKCSICQSPGINMSTCPLNPDAVHPNYEKHPLARTMRNVAPLKKQAIASIETKKTNGSK